VGTRVFAANARKLSPRCSSAYDREMVKPALAVYASLFEEKIEICRLPGRGVVSPN
jgi:hypothetical protein